MVNIDVFEKEFCSVKAISAGKWQIKTDVKFLNGRAIEIYLVEEGTKLYFVDNKCAVKYLNELYELKSNDVKTCVTNILKLYGVKMIAGELILDVGNEKNLKEKYFEFVLCINQMANMFVFFDKPE